MNKIKRLICAAVFAVLLLSGTAFAEHTGIQKTEELEKSRVLQLLEIMNGDEKGNLNLDAKVTRAEFVKMAICASTYKNSAGTSSAVSLFPDVTSSHWASGYVASAIKAGLVSGYLDGTFRPDSNVRLEEAVIIMLKLLGYTNADFSGTYPEAQLSKYDEIDLDTDISAVRGDVLTRRECMKLIYNTLCTKTKNGVYYCTTLGYATDTDNTIDYIALLSDRMTGPFVNTEASPWTSRIGVSEKTSILLDGEEITADLVKTDDVMYYSKTLNTVWVFRETKSGVCTGVSPNREKPASVTVGGKTYSLSTVEAVYKFSNYGTLKKDMLITLILGKDGSVVDAKQAGFDVIGSGEDKVSYAEVVSATLKGPYVAQENGRIPSDTQINAQDATVYKGNVLSSASDIKKYNVYYYSKLLNTVWVYDKTASGTLESVSPNRMSPTSITVSGKTYSLEGAQAQYDFSSLGTYGVGDRVTLLLGKDGAVAGVAKAGKVNPVVYGVVLSSGEKKYTDADGKSYTADCVTVFSTSGDTFTYEASGYYSEGTPVKVTVSEEKVNISKLSAPSSVSAALSATNAVNNGMFADNAEIIEYFNGDIYSTVLESRISGHKIGYKDILYYDTNSDGEITKLILDNYTGDLVDYGYIIEVDGSKYTYIIDDEETTYSSGDVKFSVREGAAYFAKSGNQIVKIGNISGAFDIYVISGNTAYNPKNSEFEISDDVKVYVRNIDGYSEIELEDLSKKNYTMTGYYDKSSESGGKIRVIVAY